MSQRREDMNGGTKMQRDVQNLKKIVDDLREAVDLLETEKDNLRQAVRKLKAENARTKEKVKKLSSHLKSNGVDVGSDDDEFPEYDDIGRNFILVGGSHDPLAIRYEANFKDKDGVEHKTAERYYWLKMAEHFKDDEARDKILAAQNTVKAEEIMKEIKNFDESSWNDVKLKIWEEGQRLKLDQHKWIANILIESGTTYIAVSHQDKQIGTGWRKNREESNKPLFWDGKNLGGKFLMRMRKELAANKPLNEEEQEEAKHRVNELKRYVWRRVDQYANRGPTRGRGYYRGPRQFNNRGRNFTKRAVSANGKD